MTVQPHPTPAATAPALCPTPADLGSLTLPRTRRGRTLHLIDIENLVDGRPTRENLIRAWDTYRHIIGINPGDQVRIACARSLAATLAFTIPTGRQLLIGANAPDGADHALINSVDIAFTVARFPTVIIASGDHIFAPLAAGLAAAGATTTAAYRHDINCSTALRIATHTQRALAITLTSSHG